jgi:hypothetical protein
VNERLSVDLGSSVDVKVSHGYGSFPVDITNSSFDVNVND